MVYLFESAQKTSKLFKVLQKKGILISANFQHFEEKKTLNFSRLLLTILLKIFYFQHEKNIE